MYREVGDCATAFDKLLRSSVCTASRKNSSFALASAVALHPIAFLQVHDFAQTLKECEMQLKQLEIASLGTRTIEIHAPSLSNSSVLNVCCSLLAVFKTAGDTLSRPLPHVYQADQQGSAVPIVPPDEMRQEVASTMGTAVRVHDLSSISQKHVSHGVVECHVALPLTTNSMSQSSIVHICMLSGARLRRSARSSV